MFLYLVVLPYVFIRVFKYDSYDKYNKNKVNTNGIDHAILLRLGYRYQKSQGGLFMRAAFTPIIYDSSNEGYGFLPWAGLGMGVSF